MRQKTQFEQDLDNPISINGNQSSKGYYNLIVSIRDVSLFSKGIKPHRHWRLKDVKCYFGLKGNTEKILLGLKDYRETIGNTELV
jgi:hypothetical protein|tara:strand:+ start:219 stop:473 length:255 start_codon:yes stop_codon:yes gene_type:complete